MDYPLAQENYNAAGNPFWETNLLWIKTANGDTYSFSDRRKTEIIGVRSVIDGTTVNRTYRGGGHIKSLPEITRTQGLTSQQHRFVLAGSSADVRDMAFGANLTRAAFEWHKGQMDADTGLLVAVPVCELYALVDEVSDNISDLGPDRSAEWSVNLTVIPHHAELEYSNAVMRTYEAGLDRAGDEVFLYVDAVADWQIAWGKEIHKHSNKRSSHHGKDGGGSPDLTGWGRN